MSYLLSIRIGASLTPSTFSALETLNRRLKSVQGVSEKALEPLKNLEYWKLPKVNPKDFVGDPAFFKTYVSSVHTLIKKFKELQKAGKENSQEFKNLQLALRRLGIDTSRVDEEVRKLAHSLRKLRQASKIDLKIQAQTERLKSQLSSWKSMVATGASLAIPIKIGMDFEAQIVRVKALARATREEFIALKEKAKELGGSTRYSATEVAQAFEYMVMAGMKTKDILVSAKDVLNLATIGNLDLARASDIATNIMSGFGLKAKELSRVVDVMAKTITTSNTSVEELGETMKYVAPVASAVGASVEEVSAMAGLLGNVGIKGSQAGTTLRAMFLRLSAPTGEAARALQMLGVITTDAQGKLKPMPQLLKEIAQSLQFLPQAQRMEILKQIFGEEAASGAMELLKKAQTGELDAYIKQIKDSKGESQRMIEDLNKTLKASFTSLFSALQTLAIEVFEPMKPIIKGFVDLLTFGVRTLTFVLKPLLPVLSPLVLFLGSVFIATKMFAIATSSLKLAQFFLSRQLLVTQARLPLMAGSLTSLRAKTLLTATSFRVLGRAMLSNPIGLILFGLSLLIGHWDKVKEVLGKVWEKLKTLNPAFFALASPLLLIFSLGKKLSSVFGFIGSLFSKFTGGVSALGSKLGSISRIGGLLLKGFRLLNLTNPFGLLITGATVLLPKLWKLIGGFEGIKKAIASVGGFFKKVFSAIGGFIGKVVSGGKELVKKGVSLLPVVSPLSAVAGIAGAVKKLFSSAPTKEVSKEVATEAVIEKVTEKQTGRRVTINIGRIEINVKAQELKEAPEKVKESFRKVIRDVLREEMENYERKTAMELGFGI